MWLIASIHKFGKLSVDMFQISTSLPGASTSLKYAIVTSETLSMVESSRTRLEKSLSIDFT
jgi:hypothetical protein